MPIPGLIASMVGSAQKNPLVIYMGVTSAVVGLTDSHTFSNVNIGPARSDRRIVLCFHAVYNGAASRSINFIEIDGSSMSEHVFDSHSGGSTGLLAGIASKAWPTGTTADFELNFDALGESTAITGMAIGVFAVYGLTEGSPHDTLEVQGFNDTDINGNIDIPAHGILICAGTGSTNTDGNTASWTGATERYDGSSNFTGIYSGTSDTNLVVETNRNIRFNLGSIPNSGTELVAISWV